MLFGGMIGAKAAMKAPQTSVRSFMPVPLSPLVRDIECWSFAEPFDFSRKLSTYVEIPEGNFIVHQIALLFDAEVPFAQLQRAMDAVKLDIAVGGHDLSEDGMPLWMFAAGESIRRSGMDLWPSIGMNTGTGISARMAGPLDHSEVSKVKGTLVFSGLRSLV